MRWRNKRRSSNIEDRRSGRRKAGGKTIGGGLGIIALAVVYLFLGKDPTQLLNGLSTPATQQDRISTTKNDDNAEFVSTILATTEDAWTILFKQKGYRYNAPKLVLFNDQVDSACGMTSSATGPFYCPGDSKVYIDLGFFRELAHMGVKGEFARAYVIAHEIGHHVQNLQGISMKVQNMQRRVNRSDANKLSVLTELQADCYAGIWIHHYEKQADIIEKGDIEEGIQAAASIGDDRMQRNAGQHVNPDAWFE
jgi:predicted metalloprotease